MKIPYVNLAAQHAPIKAEILKAIEGVLDGGQFILGDVVAEFEAAFAKLVGTKHAIAVNSGTDALILALRALKIGPGDEVITAPNSFVASASSIALVGARPVFVDVRPDMNIDATKLEAAITRRTRAIMPVHLTGHACDMEPILEVASHHKLSIVEDAAQAILAEYRGKRVGSFGNMGCFSLHPLKTLNAIGDGGVVTTNDDELATHVKLTRNLGLKTREQCVDWSSNSRLDSIQAAVLLVKLKYVEEWTVRRIANAQLYRKLLAGVTEVSMPQDRRDERNVYHTFVVQVPLREKLRAHLDMNGIGTSIHYPIPIHLQDVAKELGYKRGDFPVAEKQAERILSLPVYPELRTEDIEAVARAIAQFYERSI